MNSKLKALISGLVLSAVASVCHLSSEQVAAAMPEGEGLDNATSSDVARAINKKPFNNVLKVGTNGQVRLIAGHYSHSSHASHSSHRSHYSSYID